MNPKTSRHSLRTPLVPPLPSRSPAKAGSQTTTSRGSSFAKRFFLAAAGLTLFASASVAQVTVTGSTGANATYTSLTNAGGAFATINGAGSQAGNNIVITITADVTTEAGTTSLNNGGWTTLTVSPTGARTISGTVAGASLINLNGASNVNINGLNASGNSLVISNLSTAATAGTSTIRFINDAVNNTVQNCTILGASTLVTSGTIFFSTTTGATGNDGNIITNNNIGPAAPNFPFNAIYAAGTTTTTALNNSGVQITNNRIFDFFAAGAADWGILVSTGNTDWTITGNSLYQTATRTMTTAATDGGIQINSAGNNFIVSNNFIGGSTVSAGGTAWTIAGAIANRFRGISLNVGLTTPSSVQNNTIANFAYTSNSSSTTVGGAWVGIYLGAGSANIGNTTPNTIGSGAGTGSIAITMVTNSGGLSYGIYSDAASTVSNISNNAIGSMSQTSTTIAGGITGIAVTSGTTWTINGNTIGSTTTANSITTGAYTGTTAEVVTGINNSSSATISISNNTIQNLNNGYLPAAANSSRILTGIVSSSGVNTISGNTVRNLSTAANATGTGSSAIVGIQVTGSTAGQTVSANTIHSISGTHATAATNIYGIYWSTSSTGHIIERNFIHSLSTTSTGAAIINGIYQFNGSSTYRNNMIRLGIDATGSSLTSAALTLNGFLADPVGTNNYYFNSIFIGGTSVATGSASTAGFRRVTGADVTDFRDNIVVNNRSNSTGTGKHYAIALISGSTTFTSNYNVFHQTGTGAVFGVVTATDSATFALWKTNTGQDANSFFSDPQFINPGGTSAPSILAPFAALDLHINPSVTTMVEGNGILISPPTDDFDGQTRSGLTPTDIGADAGNFTGVDLAGPAISYTALTNTTSTANRTISATITDATGVDLTGGGGPRIYFRKGTSGAYSVATCSQTSGNAQSGTYDCTINHSTISAGGGDTVQYYVAAQDTLGNVSTNPSGGTGATPPGSTAPSSPNSYVILLVVSSYPYSNDFETNSAGYTTAINAGAVNDWILGTPAKVQIAGAHSGTQAWVTKLTAVYSNSHDAYVQSPIFNFSALAVDPTLTFWHNMDTIAPESAGWDSGVVEVSTNGGTVWTKLDPNLGAGGTFNTTNSTGWYNSSSTNGPITPPKFNGNTTTYTGAVAGWVKSTSLLVGMAGLSDVRFRWRFGSDSSGQDEGWAFDDVSVSADDITPPVITYTALGNTTSTANRALPITVTDNVGVPTSGIGLPVLYFRKGTSGAYTPNQCTFGGGSYTGTFNYSLVGGVAPGDTIQYFVAAQDTATTPNVSVNPATGASGLTFNPPNATTPPTSPNSYVVSIAYTGSYNVGTGEVFTSLTNDDSAGLFKAINNGVLTGSVTINVTTDLTAETGTIALNQWVEQGAGGYTLLIQPSGGGARVISGSNSTALINLNGADRTTINGLNSGGNSLLIRNNSATTGAVIQLTNDASNNSVTNCTIQGGNTSTSSALVLIAAGTSTGNDNNAISSNTIRDRTDVAGVPANLVASLNASTTATNSNNAVTNNQLTNFTANGFSTSATVTADNWTISGNDISQTAARTTTIFGINFGGNSGTNLISGNSIHGFNTNGTNTSLGMLIGNAIGTTISRNRIYDFQTTSGATGTIEGIEYDGLSGGTPSITVVNNMVSLAPTLATAQVVIGIQDFGWGGNTFNAFYNSIYIGGTASGSSSSWALKRGAGSPTTYTAKNNLAFNNRTGGTGNHFADGDASGASGTFVSDFNFFAGTGATAANFMDYNSTAVPFATWKTGPPARDASSIANTAATYAPISSFFADVANGDLHLRRSAPATPNPAENFGTAIAVTTDFDNDTRATTSPSPDIGADEVMSVSFSASTFAPLTGTTEGGTATITVNRTSGAGAAATVNFSVGGGSATGGASCGGVVDYVTPATTTLNFAAGDTTKTFDIVTCTDGVYEGNETVPMALTTVTGDAIKGTPDTATLTIIDIDSQPTATIGNVTQNELNSGTSLFSFVVTLSGPSATSTTINYSTAGVSATAGSDYVEVTSGSIVIPALSTTGSINITVNGDTTYENDETFTVTITSPNVLIGGTGIGTGTITNDDTAPTISINNVSVSESGGNAVFTVTQSAVSGKTTTFQYDTTNGSAVEPGDYTAATGAIGTIPAGSTTTPISIPITNDSDYEANETFTVTLSNAVNAAIVGATGTGTITNDDAPAAGATFTVNTNDDNDFGACLPTHCSLREAINAANTLADTNTINFNIPGAGVHTISPSPALPTVTQPVLIDGYSQPGASANTLAVGNDAAIKIELDGTNDSGGNGLRLTGSSTVQGLAIGRYAFFGYGIYLNGPGNAVKGCWIGVDAAGTANRANFFGINVGGSSGNTIGGAAAAERNVISGNSNTNIALSGSASNTVRNNYIGTNAAGTAAILPAPSVQAVYVEGSTHSLLDNVISGNNTAVFVNFTTGTTLIQGNLIGTKADGVTALGNSGNGIALGNAGQTVTIGGTSSGQPNVIANNTGKGIVLLNASSTKVRISANSIHDNGGLGIDLGNDGVTANDPQDADAGANNLQNFPVITSALVTGSTKTISGTLNSTPGQIYTLEFFANTTCDASGNGEGATYLGSLTTGATNGTGDVSFTFHPSSLTVGQVVTATATDSLGNTSEFSACTTVAAGAAGEIKFTSSTYSVTEDGGPASITVTRVGGSDGSISATFSTSDGSAVAPGDYAAVTGQTVSYADGETGSKTVNVTINDDSTYEGDETVVLDLGATSVNRPSGTSGDSAVLTILEDDDVPVFSIDSGVEHFEGNSLTTSYVFTVTKSGSTALSSSVVYTAQDGTTGSPATLADSDYQSATGTLTFTASQTSMQFTVLVNGDTKYENQENFIAHLSTPVNATINGAENDKLGLIDNDDAAPTISIDSVSVAEAGGPAVFTVTQSAVSGKNTTFQYSTADGSAVAPGDYTALANEIGSIPAGSTTTTISVAIINDTTFENSETFTVTMSNEVNATLGTATGTGTITDNDTAPSISIDSVSVNEAAGNAVFTVTQSAVSGKNTTFTYSTANGTAVAPGDYTAATNVAGGITAGNTTTTISIPIINDDIREGSETFTVTLSNEVNATLGTATGTGTITGNDDAPTFSIDNVTQVETDSGTTNFVFTVTKSGQTELDSTVNYHTEDGTATDANNDYEPATGTLTFGPTDTTMTVTVVVNGDTRPESDEDFSVVLDNPTGRPGAKSPAGSVVAVGTGTITNDDACPAAFTVNNNGDASDADSGDGVCSTAGSVCTLRAAIEEANALTSCGTIDINFSGVVSPISLGTALPAIDHNVNLNGPGANLLTVQRSTAGGTADFRVFEINAGKTVAIFGLTISNGNSPAVGGAGILNKGSLILTSSAVSDNVSQPGTNGGGILSQPGSSLTIKSSTISGNTSGGGGGGIWIDGTGVAATGTIINSTISGNTTPESAGGINVHTNATLTFWNTTITNNRSNTGGGGGPGAGITNFGTVRLYNTIVVANYQGTAGTAAGNFPYPAHSSSSYNLLGQEDASTCGGCTPGGLTNGVNGNQIINNTAAGLDVLGNYGGPTQTHRLQTGSPAIDMANNCVFDNSCSPAVGFALTTDQRGQPRKVDGNADSTATVDIGAYELDFPGTLKFSAANYNDTETNSGTHTKTITVQRTGGSGGAVSVHYATSDNSATTADNDYDAASGDLNWADGDATDKTFTVTVHGDIKYEADETVDLTLSAAVGAVIGSPNPATLTIVNDEATPTISIDSVTVAESAGNAVFTVTQSGVSAFNTTFTYSTADGSAVAPGDYTSATNVAGSITATNTTTTISIPINNDTIREGNETFTVTLGNPVNATIASGQGTGTGTITDNDAAPTFSIDSVTQAETNSGTTNFVFTVTKSGATELSSSVDCHTEDGTAIAPDDYTALPTTTLTFAPNETSKPVTVVVKGDTVYEPNETFTVVLTNPQGRPGSQAPTVDPTVGTGTITNDDNPPSFAINDVSHNEGNGGTTTYTFTVTKTGSTELNAKVDYATANNTATAPSDYTALTTTTLTFLPTDTTQTITVNVNGDTTPELDETFFVNLTNPVGATISDNQGLGTIVNDDCDPLPGGMVGWWPWQNNGDDIVGTNPATLVGSPTFGAGKVGQALQLNGSSQHAQAAASSSLNVGTSNGMTVDVWINPTDVSNPRPVTEWNSGTGIGIGNGIGAALFMAVAQDGGGPGSVYVNLRDIIGTDHLASTTTNVLMANTWQHVAYTYDKTANGGTLTIYVNGVVRRQVTGFGNFTPQTSHPLYFGLRPVPAIRYAGAMDEVEIFNRALSQAEIVDIYNSGVVGKCHTSTLQFSAATYGVNENGGTATITVTRTGTHDTAATVDYATVTGGTATAGGSCTGSTDYVTTTNTLSFAANEVSTTFTVQICDDAVSEGDETVNLQLSNVTGSGASLGSPSAAVLTISDDDCVEQPANMIAWYAGENNDNDIQGPTFENGSNSGAVTFAAGKVGQAFSFNGAGRVSVPANSGPLNITGNAVSMDGWINPTATGNAVYFGKGDSGFNDYVIFYDLGAPSVSAIVKTGAGEKLVRAFANYPTNTVLYTPPLNQWTHLALTYDGALIKIFVNGIQASQDAFSGNIAGDNQAFGIGGRVSGNFFSGRIDEVEVFNRALTAAEVTSLYNSGVNGKCKHGLIQFSSPTYTVGEGGGNATITVRRTDGSKGAVTARFDTSNGTATAGSDYTATTNFTVSWPDGDALDKTVPIPISDDSLYEISETVNLALTNATGGAQIGPQGTATLTITDNDTAPTISIDSVSVSEGGGNAVFTVTQSAVTGANTTFAYSTANGSATAGSDYTGATNVAGGITAGNTTTTISIPIADDGVYEGSEDFTVTLSSPVNATIASGQGTGTATITDNDAQPSFAIDDITHNEGDSSTTTYTFTVTKSGSTALSSSVNFQTQDGTATIADSDYQSTSGPLNFSVSETTKTFNVLVNGDKKVETNEAFTVHLSGASNATISDADGTGTITNDDHAPVANDVSVSTERNVSKLITLSATDADGDTLTFSLEPGSLPAHGSLGPITPTGCCSATVLYTPNCDYVGPDTFAYKATDGANDSNTATVSITVTPHTAPVVTNTTDNNAGSLRQALLNAQDGDTITFNIPTSDPGYDGGTAVWTITLTSGQLVVDKDVVISGPGADHLTVTRGTGAGAFRIFLVNSNGGCAARPDGTAEPEGVTVGSVTIEKMTISNGDATGGVGGGISNDHVNLTVNRCTLVGNSADFGGGLFNDSGVAIIRDSTFSGNSTGLDGGAVFNNGALTVTNSTFSGNNARYAGGINNGNGGAATLTVANSTFIANGASFDGGGIRGFSGSVTLGNTIVAGNTAAGSGRDIAGTVSSAGYNLIGNTTNPGDFGATDQMNVDPMLGPLKNNGGPTKTHAPLINSPAIDQGKRDAIPALTTTVDQRGSTRPVNDTAVTNAAGGDGSDIGAVEIGSFVHPTGADSWKTHFGVGDFPVPLPLPFTSPIGVECRTGAVPGDHKIIVTFTNVNTFTGVAVTTGTGSATAALSRPESPDIGGTQITVNLTGVTNAQAITVALFGVDTGTATADVGIRMGVLLGDTTATHQVDSSDVSEVQFESGHAVTGLNFRDDVTTNGEINSSDVSTVQFQSGTGF